MDVTGSRCALDAAGNFWCWDRGEPIEDVHLFGTGFDRAWGSCGMRGQEVWCFGYVGAPETMFRVIEAPIPPETPLRVDYLAEYSDYGRGCGVRRLADGSWEVVCWTNGYTTVEWAYPSSVLAVAAAVTPAGAGPRRIGLAHNVEAIDIARCDHGSCQATITLAGVLRWNAGEWEMPGTHRVAGFRLACYAAGATVQCLRADPPRVEWSLTTPAFRDHAVAWPIGTWRTVDGVPWYFEGRGLCVGGDFGVRCYDDAGALAYTVNW